MRLYIHPTKNICNANCKFCITKDQFKYNKKFNTLPDFLIPSSIFAESLMKVKDRVREIEITGGGEPSMNIHLYTLIDIIRKGLPNVYIKIYTNGLNGLYFGDVDELNVSRVHWDDGKNKEIMGIPELNLYNKLKTIKNCYFKTRLQIPLIKGYIDSPNSALEWVNKWEFCVDKFMFRELFNKCNKIKDLFVPMIDIKHDIIKLDTTGDYCDLMPIIATDGKLYKNWNFEEEIN